MKPIPTDLIDQARDMAKSNTAVKKLLEFYELVSNHSAYKSYVTRKTILDKWNEELSEKTVGILNPKTSDGTTLEKRDKEIDRIMKFLDQQLDWEKETVEMSKLLTQEELDSASAEIGSGPDRAFG